MSWIVRRAVWETFETRLRPLLRAALSLGQMSAVPHSSEVLVLLRICHAGPTMFWEELHVQQGLPHVIGLWSTSLRASLSPRYTFNISQENAPSIWSAFQAIVLRAAWRVLSTVNAKKSAKYGRAMKMYFNVKTFVARLTVVVITNASRYRTQSSALSTWQLINFTAGMPFRRVWPLPAYIGKVFITIYTAMIIPQANVHQDVFLRQKESGTRVHKGSEFVWRHVR